MLPRIIPRSRHEDETARDGVLSTLTEWHALIIGFVVGAVAAHVGAWELAALFVASTLGYKLGDIKTLGELRREPWYALGGFGIGAGAILYGPTIVEIVLERIAI